MADAPEAPRRPAQARPPTRPAAKRRTASPGPRTAPASSTTPRPGDGKRAEGRRGGGKAPGAGGGGRGGRNDATAGRAAPVSGRAPAATVGRPAAPPWLPFVGLVVATWAALPHFLTPALNTKNSVEIADHVMPGLVVLIVCGAALLVQQRGGPRNGAFQFVAGLVLVLTGLWMVATHVPLVAQATRGEAPWPGTIYHTTAAVAVLGFALLWTAVHWDPSLFED
ncbi:MAG: hypothetical protein ABR511_09145 [Acidimicrobiales bacterium]